MGKNDKKDDKKKEQLAEEQEYFHGFLDRQDLPILLTENGDFLIRTTEPNQGQARQLVISVMYDKSSSNIDTKIRHFIIQKTTKGKKNQYTIDQQTFPSVPELVDYYVQKKEPVNVANSSTPAFLKAAISRQNWELSHDDITQSKKLGEGAFGEVWAGKLRLKSKRKVDVAIKIAKTQTMSKEKIRDFMKEARLMRNFEHPNVVKLYGVAIEQEPLMIVMELIDGGALDDYLKKNRGKVPISEKTDQLCMGAAWGVEYLHLKLCIHRDIAARNCLYANHTVKISDFGLSREGNIYQLTSAKKLPIKWLAPETLANGIYTQKTDVYSFGIMCWEIFANGDEPYQGMTNAEVQTKVVEGFRMELNVETPEPLADLINQHCWDADPESRWSMSQVARELEKITGQSTPAANVVAKKNRDKGTIEQTTVDRDTTQDKTIDPPTCDQGTVEAPTVETPPPPSPSPTPPPPEPKTKKPAGEKTVDETPKEEKKKAPTKKKSSDKAEEKDTKKKGGGSKKKSASATGKSTESKNKKATPSKPASKKGKTKEGKK